MKKEKDISKGEIIIYRPKGGEVEVKAKLEKETIWLSLNEIAFLFNADKSGISRHIKNIYENGELNPKATVAKTATVQKEGGREIKRNIEYYNLDMIISVGYRVNSKKATQFRVWATRVLKQHILQGYTINQKRLLETRSKFNELQNSIAFLREKSKKKLIEGQEKEILDLLASYAKTITILGQYDKGRIQKLRGEKAKFVLEYDSCKNIIVLLRENLITEKKASSFFGVETEGKFEGVVKNLYQTFDKKMLYKTIEEKAAHLLYFTIKDHPFVDGNKRIASFLFVYFLDKNNYLYRKSGEKKINDNALVALALLIAVSNFQDKDILINIITNLISSDSEK